VRRWRRWLAGLMILGFASAQFIGLAHACVTDLAVQGSVSHPASQAADVMPADCPALSQGGVSHATCEAQCLPRQQADRPAELRIALAPPSVLVVRLVEVVVPNGVRATPPRATIASPPLSLLFSRFLN
jgi:hypothetical protein